MGLLFIRVRSEFLKLFFLTIAHLGRKIELKFSIMREMKYQGIKFYGGKIGLWMAPNHYNIEDFLIT